MDSWIVWMGTMNVNVQGTSVWDQISFIVNKIRPVSKLLRGMLKKYIRKWYFETQIFLAYCEQKLFLVIEKNF